MFITPGFFFAMSNSWARVLAGDDAGTTSTKGVSYVSTTGTRSFFGSYGMLGNRRFPITTGPEVATPRVYPSAGDLATASTPIMPSAPVLFSTSTGWPRIGASFCAMMRGTTSPAPPAGKGTMMRSGLAGQVWPKTEGAPIASRQARTMDA